MKIPLTIGHDLDGCHFPLFELYIQQVNDQLGLSMTFDDFDQYSLERVLLERSGIPLEQGFALLREVGNNHFRSAAPYPHAVSAFNRLAQIAPQVVITARGAHDHPQLTFADPRGHTLEWLSTHGYNHQGVHHRHDKLVCAKELGITHMIEDHPGNAYELAKEGVRVFLIDCPYNRNPHPRDRERYGISPLYWKELHQTGEITRVDSVAHAADLILQELDII